MFKHKKFLLLLVVALVGLMVLSACGGTTPDVEEAAEEVAQEVQEEAAAVEEAVVEEAEAVEEAVAEEVEKVEEAVVEEATAEPVEEAVEEPAAEEEMAMEVCGPAAEGALAGVDPRDQEVLWWHNHTGSRDEQLAEMVADYNASNECGITIDSQSQGGYNEIRDKVNASISAGEAPAALIVGYQNDQAFYQLNEGLADLNTYVDDPHWGLTEEERADFFSGFFNQSVHAAFDNQRLGFPPNRSIEVMYYNQSWLEELGFEGPPTTPDEFKEMACAAAAANGDGTGGYILRDDASACSCVDLGLWWRRTWTKPARITFTIARPPLRP